MHSIRLLVSCTCNSLKMLRSIVLFYLEDRKRPVNWWYNIWSSPYCPFEKNVRKGLVNWPIWVCSATAFMKSSNTGGNQKGWRNSTVLDLVQEICLHNKVEGGKSLVCPSYQRKCEKGPQNTLKKGMSAQVNLFILLLYPIKSHAIYFIALTSNLPNTTGAYN